MINGKIIYVASDDYIDAVPLALKALHKYWPDHWERIEVIYNNYPPTRVYDVPVTLVKLGKDRGWIENMLRYTDTVGAKEFPFLLMLEDYLVCDAPRVDLLELATETIYTDPGIAMVRVKPTPGPTRPWTDDSLGEIDKGVDYCASLQAGVWCPHHLHRLLQAIYDAGGRTAWDFEIIGSRILKDLDIGIFLGTKETGISYKNLYRRGKKVPAVVEWAQERL